MEKVFKAVDDELDNATDFINAFMEAADIEMKTIMQIDVAFEEMFVNVAHYAYEGDSGDVAVRIEKTDACVEVTLADSGIRYNPLEKTDPDITLNAEERPIGGLGIFMVKKSMDQVDYEYKDGQNILTIKKN